MRRGRADKNQAIIVKALRDVGATVAVLSAVGNGVPDLLVGHRNLNYLIETKNKETEGSYATKARANLMRTPAQDKFHAEWRGRIDTVFTSDEALKVIGVLK